MAKGDCICLAIGAQQIRLMLIKSRTSLGLLSPIRRSHGHSARRGAATIELATCLPLLCLVVFGSIQASNLIFLKHAVTSAAYEGTIELVRPNSTNTSVTDRIEHVLAAYEVNNGVIEILPSGTNVSALPTGTPIQIRVRADVDSNLAISGWFPLPATIQHTAVGPR